MVDSTTLVVVMLAGAALGLAAHEGAHYVVCRAANAPARPVWYWDGWRGPIVAIRTNVRAHTARSYRVTCLAPLALCVPAFAVGSYVALSDPVLGFGGLMFAIATIPSGPDLKYAYHAPVLDDLHAGWFGEHATHAAAEGIPA